MEKAVRISEVKVQSLFFVVFIFLLYFQNYLITLSAVFGYIDEVIALLSIAYFLSVSLANYRYFKKDLAFLKLSGVIVVGGLICNIVFKVQNSAIAIIIDILSNFKFLFIYLGGKTYLRRVGIKRQEILRPLLFVIKIYLSVLIVCAALNLVMDIGMSNEIRYGIRAFSFVYGTPGHIINQMTYSLLLLVAERIYCKKSNAKWQMVCILIALCTTKTRAFVLVAVYCFLYLIFVVLKYKKLDYKLLLILFAISIAIGFTQFTYYFTTPMAPRNMFVKGAVRLVKEYFPFGTGFATFGSSAAAEYYSKIYYVLGFSDRWGMTPDNMLFMNDNYLPMIFGQFGIIFGILFCYLILKFFIQVIKDKKTGGSKSLMITLFFVLDIFLSCIQSSYLAHYSAVTLIMLFVVFFYPNKSELKYGN